MNKYEVTIKQDRVKRTFKIVASDMNDAREWGIRQAKVLKNFEPNKTKVDVIELEKGEENG